MTTDLKDARRLTYTFLRLPYHVRIRIVRDLGLVSGKTPLSEEKFFEKCFRKAKTDKKLEKLWDETFKETKDAEEKMGKENPFKAVDKPAESITVSYLDGFWDEIYGRLVDSAGNGKPLSNGTLTIRDVSDKHQAVQNGQLIKRTRVVTIVEETFSKPA